MTPKPYQIIDRHTGQIVGHASMLKRAIAAVDKLDNAYGGYRYTWRHTPKAQTTEETTPCSK